MNFVFRSDHMIEFIFGFLTRNSPPFYGLTIPTLHLFKVAAQYLTIGFHYKSYITIGAMKDYKIITLTKSTKKYMMFI